MGLFLKRLFQVPSRIITALYHRHIFVPFKIIAGDFLPKILLFVSTLRMRIIFIINKMLYFLQNSFI